MEIIYRFQLKHNKGGRYIVANYVLDYTGLQVNTKLTKAESIDNKVTALSSSSTDTEYPSAKAVYDQLILKADLTSPALTGVPTAPTAAVGTDTTQIATTAFVQTAISNIPETYTKSEVDAAIQAAIGGIENGSY